jgi:hypothetical protein
LVCVDWWRGISQLGFRGRWVVWTLARSNVTRKGRETITSPLFLLSKLGETWWKACVPGWPTRCDPSVANARVQDNAGPRFPAFSSRVTDDIKRALSQAQASRPSHCLSPALVQCVGGPPAPATPHGQSHKSQNPQATRGENLVVGMGSRA